MVAYTGRKLPMRNKCPRVAGLNWTDLDQIIQTKCHESHVGKIRNFEYVYKEFGYFLYYQLILLWMFNFFYHGIKT